MIISKYEKSYDTADGTEEQFNDPHRHAGRTPGRIPGRFAEHHFMKSAGQRWDDDGGSFPAPPRLPPLEPASKPSWSVLSLIDLNEAIRLEHSPDSPLRQQRQEEETERRRLHAIEVEDERMATFAHTERNRYRNHWENT